MTSEPTNDKPMKSSHFEAEVRRLVAEMDATAADPHAWSGLNSTKHATDCPWCALRAFLGVSR